jgi:hypothetical protein
MSRLPCHIVIEADESTGHTCHRSLVRSFGGVLMCVNAASEVEYPFSRREDYST